MAPITLEQTIQVDKKSIVTQLLEWNNWISVSFYTCLVLRQNALFINVLKELAYTFLAKITKNIHTNSLNPILFFHHYFLLCFFLTLL